VEKLRVPSTVQPLLNEYVQQLTYQYDDNILGVYVYNSIALGAYDETRSDIDLLILIKNDFDDNDWNKLYVLHQQLGKKYALAKRMEGMYIKQGDISKVNEEIDPYLYFVGTKLHKKGHHDLNFVTWYTLKHNGLTVHGSPINKLHIDVTEEQLLRTMAYNLHTYWGGKAKKKLIFLLDGWVEFAVLTLCRVVYTIDTKKVTSKLDAATYTENQIEIAFQLLIQEAVRIRTNTSPQSYYASKIQRAKEVRRFITYIVDTYGEKC
jgi:Domain of unknown function (DUF4111)/Nucleotidyltransferase domain